jgi:hypothetical protein
MPSDVRSASKALELLRGTELSRCANRRHRGYDQTAAAFEEFGVLASLNN